MAVPTEEQNRRRAGVEKGEDRDRLMRFCTEASCGVKDWTGRAKLTAHAQWIICVVSSLSLVKIGAESPNRASIGRMPEGQLYRNVILL